MRILLLFRCPLDGCPLGASKKGGGGSGRAVLAIYNRFVLKPDVTIASEVSN